ncbi:alkaline shock response membrane anchor protein AmaP [Nonomuraea sp. NPDC005650]|uniref:alkaline shock response membrane anchor protein AmaP n=1 Tax=Nonomuraea sp. NPDC005650 TaxID=3157045 RepID=UPI0033B48066
MSRKASRGNRWGLALVGTVLVVLGGLAAARGLGGFGSARTPIVDGGVQGFFARNSPAIWWAVAIVSIVVALLALRWLLAQGRREITHRPIRLERSPTGFSEVSADGMAHAVAADVASSPAVLSADAGLTGSHHRPEVRLRVVADERAPMGELSRHLSTIALPHMRDTLQLDQVQAVARVSLEPPPAPHRMVH